MILDNVAAIFDNLFLLINQLLLALNYLLELNYTVVSSVLDFAGKFFATLKLIVEGVHIAIVDFVDQYGELCTNLLHLAVFVFNRIVEYALLAVVCALSFLNYCLTVFLGLVQVPNLVIEKIISTADQLSKSTVEVVHLPIVIVYSVIDGFSMIIKTIFDAWVYVLCGVFETFASVSNFALNSFAYCFRLFVNGIFFLIRQPINAVVYVLRGIYNVPMEAFIGLIICVCIYYLFKFGIIRLMLFAWLRFCRNLCIALLRIMMQALYKARYYLLPVGEMIIMYTVPQVMIVFQVFRLAKRPISTLIACVRVIYNYYLRVTGRTSHSDSRFNPVNDDHDDNNAMPSSESTDRLMCIICQDAEKTVMSQPCRHVCMCRICADEVLRARRQCPMCRSYIREIVDVYL